MEKCSKKIFPDSAQASRYCADSLIDIIKNKPDALICLAAGHTSLEFFDILVREFENGNVDFSRVKAVGLDEWVGVSGQDDGSCESFLQKNIFGRINIDSSNIRLFDGKAADLKRECLEMDEYITMNGGIDYMFLGLGMNGHLALNEPGVDPESTSHVMPLDSVTQDVATKYFKKMPVLSRGITLGIKNILDSKRIHVLVTGKKKSGIIKRLFDSQPTNMLPATLLFGHENAEFVMDKQAASLLE
ncbi:MAG: 6-phosphogluconolactonase [Burkholderiales bacterium]